MVEHEKSEERKQAENAQELLPVSATPGEFARTYLGIPENVRDLVIVDLTAGASSLVPQLLTEGADARAVDPIYRLSPQELLNRLQTTLEDIIATRPPRIGRPLWTASQQAMGEFAEAYRKFPEKYYASSLPHLNQTYFPDNFADMAVSLHGISQFGENPELLFQSVVEAMRILKPGGKFVMAPINILPQEEKSQIAIFKPILKQMQQLGEVHLERNVRIPNRPDQPTMNRLEIIKPNQS